jgi:hypothetical protein
MSEHENEIIKNELRKAILHLQKIIPDYLEFDGHSRILAMKLVLIERKLLDDFFKMDGNDAEFEDEGENEEGMIFHSPGKKDLLH